MPLWRRWLVPPTESPRHAIRALVVGFLSEALTEVYQFVTKVGPLRSSTVGYLPQPLDHDLRILLPLARAPRMELLGPTEPCPPSPTLDWGVAGNPCRWGRGRSSLERLSWQCGLRGLAGAARLGSRRCHGTCCGVVLPIPRTAGCPTPANVRPHPRVGGVRMVARGCDRLRPRSWPRHRRGVHRFLHQLARVDPLACALRLYDLSALRRFRPYHGGLPRRICPSLSFSHHGCSRRIAVLGTTFRPHGRRIVPATLVLKNEDGPDT